VYQPRYTSISRAALELLPPEVPNCSASIGTKNAPPSDTAGAWRRPRPSGYCLLSPRHLCCPYACVISEFLLELPIHRCLASVGTSFRSINQADHKSAFTAVYPIAGASVCLDGYLTPRQTFLANLPQMSLHYQHLGQTTHRC
jgi:hypothetical protein